MTWVNKNHMGPYATPVETKHSDVSSTQLRTASVPPQDVAKITKKKPSNA